MQRIILLLGLLLVLMIFMAAGPAQSQAPESCPQIVQVALDTTDQVCQVVGENQICYGHVLVDVSPRPGVDAFEFDTEGDTAELFDVNAVRLSPMNVEVGVWGVALINMQAYLQYAQPEDVTFLLFGDVELEDASTVATSIPVTIWANEFVNARLGPSATSGVIETLLPGQTLAAKGRLADNSWIRVVLPSTGRVGWVDARYVVTESDLTALNVVDGLEPYYGPMQAFYFRSGIEDCFWPESRESGLLIQTPEGVAEVTLLVNEVNIEMQATAYVQAQPGGRMTLGVLDGWAEVAIDGRRQPVFAGTQVNIPISNALSASGDASAPEPYDLGKLQALPLGMLDTQVAIADPLSDAEIAARIRDWNDAQLVLVEGEPEYFIADNGTVLTITDEKTYPSVVDETTTLNDNAVTENLQSPTSDDITVIGPPGLEGALPPGQGGENPGDGGTPPGQIKQIDN